MVQTRDRKTDGRSLKAFTLAEVLITLGIIGVVAAMTIPTLLNNTNDKETVTRVKKIYSVLSQAYTMAAQESGTPDTWNLSEDAQGTVNMMNQFVPYLSVTKKCIGTAASNYQGCFPAGDYYYLNSTAWTDIDALSTEQKVILSDGTLLTAEVHSSTCTAGWGLTGTDKQPCGAMTADVNGAKKPNQLGKDVFVFWVTKSGIYPLGLPQDSNSFEGQCKLAAATGFGCTAWVIYKENLDYTKCHDLNWDTKTKCN